MPILLPQSRSSRKLRPNSRSMAYRKLLARNQNDNINEIGQVMQPLVDAKQPPILILRYVQLKSRTEPLFAPVDVIVKQEFAHNQERCHDNRCGEYQEDNTASNSMNCRMQHADRMRIDPLVLQLAFRLKKEIREQMLRFKQSNRGHNQVCCIAHDVKTVFKGQQLESPFWRLPLRSAQSCHQTAVLCQ